MTENMPSTELLSGMYARDIMTVPCITVNPNASIADVAYLMQRYSISSVVVAECDLVVGIVTERDFVKVYATGIDTSKVVAKDFMSTPVIKCTPDAKLGDVISLMVKSGVRHIPVVKDGHPIGMISSTDIMSKLGVYIVTDTYTKAFTLVPYKKRSWRRRQKSKNPNFFWKSIASITDPQASSSLT